MTVDMTTKFGALTLRNPIMTASGTFGSWATNVDWDEYLIRVQNLTDEPIRVTNIAVFDSLDTRIEVGGSRRQLVEGTKMTKRRHKDEGLKVKAGANAGTLVATGGLVVVAGAVVGYSALAGSAGALAASSAAAASLVLLAPALIFGGVVRGMNNSKR